MDSINMFMNIAAPLITINALFFFLPPYLFLKFLLSILRSLFAEDVAGKVVVIAGASSGIGEHLAYEYASRGACLVLGARRENSLQDVANIALRLGSPAAIAVRTDVSVVEDCKRLIDEAIDHFGHLDHLVTDAGVTPVFLFEEATDLTKIQPVMDINFWGSVYMTRFAIPHLRKTRGKIIAIASSAVWLKTPRLSLYCASKAAVISFYETLRVELGSDVGITLVMPGLTESEMTKGKFMTTEGLLKVDQDLRDVEVGIIPIERVKRSAKAIVDSACRGDKYLTEPRWMKTMLYLKMFWPEIIEWTSRLFLLTPPGVPPEEALSKKLLDATRLKKCLYPASVLSPAIKKD